MSDATSTSSAGAPATMSNPTSPPTVRAHDDPRWVRVTLVCAAVAIMVALVVVPLVNVFVEAFAARELIPRMEALGSDEEIAGVSLGASGWQVFRLITLPNIKWGLLYGIILCNARAMGEFGAVFVVSGHIAGKTDTMPLRIEKLFQEYNLPGAFALSSVLAMLALVTLFAKTALEWNTRRDLAEATRLQSQRGEA